jgi:prepilin-type N-terminal cleavage/methylation domain-containing protein/prepilin-type processing-associated H-X9-DG protein
LSRTRAASRRTRAASPAFTLIELLVVVALIAVIAAVLFPVFSRSREKARASACFSNYHQIGAAVSMYATDFDGDTPPDGGSFGGVIADCRPYTGAAAVFACPDDFDREREGRPGSYRMPSLYQGRPISCGWPDPYSSSTPPTPSRSSTTTLMYEAEQDFTTAPINPTYRHSGGTQVLYFDGHTRWVKGTGPKDNDD